MASDPYRWSAAVPLAGRCWGQAGSPPPGQADTEACFALRILRALKPVFRPPSKANAPSRTGRGGRSSTSQTPGRRPIVDVARSPSSGAPSRDRRHRAAIDELLLESFVCAFLIDVLRISGRAPWPQGSFGLRGSIQRHDRLQRRNLLSGALTRARSPGGNQRNSAEGGGDPNELQAAQALLEHHAGKQHRHGGVERGEH
jgi:hypothetical protein